MNNEQLRPKMEFKSIRHIVEYAAKTYGNNTAFSYRLKPTDKEKVTVSYIEFRDDVRALASEMLYRKMEGKHIVAIGKMSYDFIVTYYATLLIGAVLVPLDRDWSATELANTAKNADVDYLFCDYDLLFYIITSYFSILLIQLLYFFNKKGHFSIHKCLCICYNAF